MALACTLAIVRGTMAGAQESADCEARFAVLGDYGLAGPAEESVAALIKGWHPDFIVTAGDNNYPNGAADTIDANIGQYFHEYIHPYRGSHGPGALVNRFFPALGNHDWRSEGATPYLDYFELPGNERYYSIVRGPVALFVLDSDAHEPDGNTADSRQASWLRAALAASASPWRIVVLHHPPWSSSTTHGSSPDLQWPYGQWGADLVLAGHDHVYERLQLDGVGYVTVGTGGANLYGFRSILLPLESALPGSIVRYAEQFGALQVTASASELTLRFITVDGKTVDTATLENANGRTRGCGRSSTETAGND